MEEKQKKFIKLAKKKEELVKQIKEVSEELDEVMAEVGEGTYIQCSEGLVFKIQKWKGKFVTPQNLEYVRTKREGESRGTLSKKEAFEKGFKI